MLVFKIYVNENRKIVVDNIENGILKGRYTNSSADKLIKEMAKSHVQHVTLKDKTLTINSDSITMIIEDPLKLERMKSFEPLANSMIAQLEDEKNDKNTKVDTFNPNILNKLRKKNYKLITAAILIGTLSMTSIQSVNKKSNDMCEQEVYEELPIISNILDNVVIDSNIPNNVIAPVEMTFSNKDNAAFINTNTQSFQHAAYKENRILKNIAQGIDIYSKDQVINDDIVRIDYEDRTDSQTAQITKELYLDKIKKASEKYGLDYKLVLAIATQESREHSSEISKGGAIGLMQVQYNSWVNRSIKAYNFNTQQYENVEITDRMLRECYTNIEVGCMIFQHVLVKCNYNPLAAIEAYNKRATIINEVVEEYAHKNNKTKDEVLSDFHDIGWMDELNYKVEHGKVMGTSHYLERILSYVGNLEELTFKTPENETVTIKLSNELQKRR